MSGRSPKGGRPRVVVIGAGPAGLTAAHELATRHGIIATVLEADAVVGGLSRTVERDGWRFDIGGHRFFTKVPEVAARWHEILPGEDFLLRPRRSRIYYDGKYFHYPLSMANALSNLGPREAILSVLSYLWARIRPPRDQTTLESWIVARFGRRLYRHFFETYNEKIWGVPVDQLPADFAAQRIKDLSLGNALTNALLPRRRRKVVTSLIEEFHYPRYGPGMMWERCRDLVVAMGCPVLTGQRVVAVRHEGGRAVAVVAEGTDGTQVEHASDHVISSMPLPELVEAMDPPAPKATIEAAHGLRHRDLVTVALVVPEALGFPDNWIYVHAPGVAVARIQNFGAWSPYLVKEGRACLGLEYFVFQGDELWSTPDDALVALATQELKVLGLVDPEQVEDGYVVRTPKAYPFYDETYRAKVARIVEWLGTAAANVHPVGRNGMHRYNNQDHSMVTAMLTARNIADGTTEDVWSVNVDEVYHEEHTGPTAPARPR